MLQGKKLKSYESLLQLSLQGKKIQMFDFNLLLIISLAVLAFFLFCIFIVILPVAWQLSKTLSSVQYLLDTLNGFEEDIKEIRQSISDVKSVVQVGSGAVKSSVEGASVFVKSSLAGVLAGIREYFSPCKTNDNGNKRDER